MAGRKGTEFASQWWAKRWLAVLQSFGWESRLARGRSYARHGHVLSIEVSPGLVEAKVQGSRPRPYAVKIKVRAWRREEWRAAVAVLGQQAAFAAKLLAGEMPTDVEGALATAGLSLFPDREDITTTCSCPDWANPCKHVAAVYYLLGQRFDEDPFLLFLLRGRSREELLSALRAERARHAAARPARENPLPPLAPSAAAEAAPLPSDPDLFWSIGEGLEDFTVCIKRPTVPLALIKQAGTPPWYKGRPDFQTIMAQYYQEVTRRAIEAALGGVGGAKPAAPDPE